MRREVEEALKELRARAKWLMPPRVAEPLKVEEAFREALKHPLTTPSLDEEVGVERAVIVVPDHTRPPSPFIAQLVEAVEGLAREVMVVVAGGTHPPPPLSRLKQALGGLVEEVE